MRIGSDSFRFQHLRIQVRIRFQNNWLSFSFKILWNDFRHYKKHYYQLCKFKFSGNYFEIKWKSKFLIFDSSLFDQTFAQFWSKMVQNCYFWDIDSHHFQNRFRFPTLEPSTRFPNPILDALVLIQMIFSGLVFSDL